MELKTKVINWSAGFPVVMLNEKTAEKIGVSYKDKVVVKTISTHPDKISATVDTVGNLISQKKILVSSELKEILGLKKGEIVNVMRAPMSKSLTFIKRKLDGKRFSQQETSIIINDIVNNSLSEAEIALFVSAMYEKGMSMKETIYLIKAMLNSGNNFKLKDKYVVDKHSIGGIPGNRTTPIVVSICAAAGLTMPKSSSRAITSAAGTADVVESVASVEFSIGELRKILAKTNGCFIWGGGLGMVPADAKIIKIEKALRIDPEAQLLASIIAKKLSVGSKYIIIDIPYGKTAKIKTRKKALILKKKFEYLGRYFHRKIKIILTDGTQPIGNGIGPALEMIDIIKVLDPKQQGPQDLENKSLLIAGHLLEMTGLAEKKKGVLMAMDILDSGKAYKKFREIIKAQKGDLSRLRCGKFSRNIIVKRAGKISEIDNKKINLLARVAGSPLNKFSGLYLHHHLREEVRKGEKILTIYSDSRSKLAEAVRFYKAAKPIKIK